MSFYPDTLDAQHHAAALVDAFLASDGERCRRQGTLPSRPPPSRKSSPSCAPRSDRYASAARLSPKRTATSFSSKRLWILRTALACCVCSYAARHS